jgi:carbamoyl-phosphate synthase/aspartate carbamoyltransferase
MGYPLAFIAVKLGHDIPFNEIKNLCFEPSLDHLAIKIRSWDLKKSNHVLQLLSSSVKSLGEVKRRAPLCGDPF